VQTYNQDFSDGFFGKSYKLVALKTICISFSLKRALLAKTLSNEFSQVGLIKE
jgi:hypothetical protein